MKNIKKLSVQHLRLVHKSEIIPFLQGITPSSLHRVFYYILLLSVFSRLFMSVVSVQWKYYMVGLLL